MVPAPDIIILTETYLYSDISNAELGFIGFNIFRRDRYTEGDSYGGGILIAVKTNFYSSLIHSDECTEQIFISISSRDMYNRIIVGGVYIPPNSASEIYIDHAARVEALCDTYSDHKFIIAGDYNLPYVYWKNDDSLLATCCDRAALTASNSEVICNQFSFLNLYQHYPVHRVKKYTLDLLFSTLDMTQIRYIQSDDFLVPVDPHHDPAFFSVSSLHYLESSNGSTFRNFKSADYTKICEAMGLIDWERVLDGFDVNENTRRFYDVLTDIIGEYIPLKTVKPDSYPPWFSRELKELIVEKKKLHKLWLQSGYLCDYIHFKKVRAKCIRLSRVCYNEYIDNVERQSAENVSYFWKYVNSINKYNSLPDNMFLANIRARSFTEIAELFASHFSSTYVQSSSSLEGELVDTSDFALNTLEISKDEILQAIRRMKPSSSSGPDVCPGHFLKNCASILVTPLTKLFNDSLSQGIMPESWKVTHVVPVFKNGD